MSYIRFHTNFQQNRVEIPSCKRLPPNPHIGGGLEAIRRATAPPSQTTGTDSECPPESRDDKTLRYRLIATDQRSFLTGSAAADLQAAHIINIINAVRLKTERKEQVEALLTQQKLHHPPQHQFILDGVSNAILLEASFHTQWDRYGTFCFVPMEQDAMAMLDKLRTINETWKQMQREHGFGSVPRPLDISQPPFNSPHWEVVILYPHAMLPNGQPLSIAQNPFFYQRGQPAAFATTGLDWKFWVASGDRLSSYHNPNEYHEPFIAENARDGFHSPPISSLAMVINGYHKLNQFMRQNEASASDRVKNFEQLMSDLVTEIFFVPSSEDGYASVVTMSHLPPPVPAILPPSTQSNTSLFGTFQLSECHHTLTSSDPSNLRMLGGFSDEEDLPEVPNIDGLTDSEFKLLAEKASDPYLNAKERADSAVMMLFGTHGYDVKFA